MLKAVFFDMDGVLADTEPLHFKALCMLLEKQGKVLESTRLQEFIGVSEKEIWNKARKEFSIDKDFDTFESERRKLLFSLLSGLKPTPGCTSLISDLKKHNIILGVVTSSGREVASKILSALSLDNEFSCIITADDVKQKKPAAEPYLFAAKKIKVSPTQCIAIEDSSHGIHSAKDAGLFCIGLNIYNDERSLKKADCIIKSFLELSFASLSGLLDY